MNKLPGHAVSISMGAIRSTEAAISKFVFIARPVPTLIFFGIFINFRPKSFFRRSMFTTHNERIIPQATT